MKKIYLITLFACLFINAIAQEISIKVVPIQTETKPYKWDLSADNENINFKNIKRIIYHLDGLLCPNPIQETDNSNNNFLIYVSCSEESDADAEIYYNDETISKVDFRLGIKSNISLKIANTARKVEEGRWEWDAFIAGNSTDISKIDHVNYQLSSGFKSPYRPVSKIGNVNKPFMISAMSWGVINLKAKVYFKDGKTFSLEHILQFDKIRVVVFYLASNVTVTKPIAEEIARTIARDNRFTTQVKEISDITSKANGYNLSINEIRYEKLEEGYANDILALLKQENINYTIEKNIITYKSPEYLSIFIIK